MKLWRNNFAQMFDGNERMVYRSEWRTEMNRGMWAVIEVLVDEMRL